MESMPAMDLRYLGEYSPYPMSLTRTRTTNSFFPLLKLPDELIVQILRHRLVLQKPIANFTHTVHSKRALLPLLLTNKAVSAMTVEVYYGGNTFIVERNKSHNTNPINTISRHQYAPEEGMKFSTSIRFMYPHPALGALVTRLELKINVSFESLYYLRERLETPWLASRLIFYAGDASYGWGYLLMDPMQDDWKQTAKWQHFFRRIHHLKLVLGGDCAKNEICFKKGKLPKYLEELSQLWSPLRTQELEIELRGIYCSCRNGCGGPCEEELERIITGMVHLRDSHPKKLA